MRNVREMYYSKEVEEIADGYWWGVSDYQPILNAIAPVAVQVCSGSYSGDTMVLYLKEGKWGYMRFGWGSCSACDALQGCKTWEQVQELADGFERSVQWFDSKEDALKFFREHDWAGEYWSNGESEEFVKRAIEKIEQS